MNYKCIYGNIEEKSGRRGINSAEVYFQVDTSVDPKYIIEKSTKVEHKTKHRNNACLTFALFFLLFFFI